MQLGILSEGIKRKVLKDIDMQIEEQKIKFDRDCKATQVAVYGPGGVIVRHDPRPLDNFKTAALMDALRESIKEQLAHVSDQIEVGVSFQLTIHRPEPI